MTITGVVTADRQAIIRLTVRGPAGQEHEIEAIIDTGFDGWLSLPSSLIALLGLVWRRRGRALLADGSDRVFEIYEAHWYGKGRIGGSRWTRLQPHPCSACLYLRAMS